jgi:hypothetical protein
VYDVEDDDEQVDITHGIQVSKFGGQFLLYTITREDILIGQKFVDFDINLSSNNLPTSICQRMAKKLMTMKLKIGGTVQDSRITNT